MRWCRLGRSRSLSRPGRGSGSILEEEARLRWRSVQPALVVALRLRVAWLPVLVAALRPRVVLRSVLVAARGQRERVLSSFARRRCCC